MIVCFNGEDVGGWPPVLSIDEGWRLIVISYQNHEWPRC